MKCDVLIVDGRHALWRASDTHSTLEAMGEDGVKFPTGGVYGWLQIVMRAHSKYGGRVVVAWEGVGQNFRSKLWPNYKRKNIEPDAAARELISEMGVQEHHLKRFLQVLGVRQYYGLECEADDVIGRLAVQMAVRKRNVYIYSGDSDLRQLVQEQYEHQGFIKTISPGVHGSKAAIYGAQEVYDKHGVNPNQISDLKALAGDASDGIPGAPGIGPKTAAALIRGFGCLRVVMEVAADPKENWPVAPRFRDVINREAENLVIYHKLTRILTECKMEQIPPEKSKTELLKLLMQFKFRSLVAPLELRELMSLGG